MKELTWRTTATPANRKRTPEEKTLLMEMEESFRIMFPSHETVRTSKRGTSSGGTICLDPKHYQRDQFPKELFRDCKSRRTGLLMHSKTIFTAPTKTDGGRSGAWAYVGSANLSESAWGRLTKNKSTKQVKLYCRNWECGVVIPVNRSTASLSQNIDTPATTPQQTAQDHDIDLDSVFKGVVPVPMDFPGVVYGQDRPWFRNEQ